jgi:hypothetical protein
MIFECTHLSYAPGHMQYDSEGKYPEMMEHARTFSAYVEELRKSLVRLEFAHCRCAQC